MTGYDAECLAHHQAQGANWHCRLPEGHQGDHAEGPMTWSAVGSLDALREQVAEALWVSLLGKYRRGEWEDCPPQHRDWWLAQADAVLVPVLAHVEQVTAERDRALAKAESSERFGQRMTMDLADEEERAEAAEVAALRERLAEVAADLYRNHDMPPNKDSRSYSYRMGWWDGVHHAAKVVERAAALGVTE